MHTFKNIAIKAALLSGSFIRNNLGRIKSLSYKDKANIVTNVDKTSERLVIDCIRKNFPSHNILSEECGLEKRRGNFTWIIDPLDGTTNFVHGFAFFCISIGLEIGKDIVLGVVYDPMREELFFAQKNKGAYLNKKRIYVSTIKLLNKSLLATGFSYRLKRDIEDNNILHFATFLNRSQAIRRAGSATLDLCYVACGRFDGFWELDLHAWDTAAGSLMVKEAKGKVTQFDGSQFSIYDKNILASNGKIHKVMMTILARKRLVQCPKS